MEITDLETAASTDISVMALTVSVSEARASLATILDRIVEGDEITITRNGRPVAVMIRPDRVRHRHRRDVPDGPPGPGVT